MAGYGLDNGDRTANLQPTPGWIWLSTVLEAMATRKPDPMTLLELWGLTQVGLCYQPPGVTKGLWAQVW